MEKAKNHWFKELEENVIAVGIIIMFIMETVNVICKFLAPGWMGIPEEISIFAISGYVSSVQAIVQREVPISSLMH